MTNWEKFVQYNHVACGMQYEAFGTSTDVDSWEDEFVICAECGDVVVRNDFESYAPSRILGICPICHWDGEAESYHEEDEEDEDEEDEED